MALSYQLILCMCLILLASIHEITGVQVLDNNNEMPNSGSGEHEITESSEEFRTAFTSTSLENQVGEVAITSTTPSNNIAGSTEIKNSILDNDPNTSSQVFTTSQVNTTSDLDDVDSEIPLTTVPDRGRVNDDSKLQIENITVNFINKSCAEISWYRKEKDCLRVEVKSNPEMTINNANSNGVYKTQSCKLQRGKYVKIGYSLCNGKQAQKEIYNIFTEPSTPNITGYSEKWSMLTWKEGVGNFTFFQLVMKFKLSKRKQIIINTNETRYMLNNTIPGDTIEATIRAAKTYKRNQIGDIYSGNSTYEFTLEPEVPQNIKTTFLNTTCLEVSWNSGHVCRDTYILEINRKISNISVNKGCETKDYTEMTCKLNPDENQNIAIRTFSNGIEKSVTRTCPARCDIHAANITSSSITISCGNQNILKKTASKHYVLVDNKVENFVSLPHYIDGLLPATDHIIRVKIRTRHCNSTMSNRTIRTLDAKSKEVQDLTLNFVKGEMKMTVSWSKPKQTNGKILLYRVELDDGLGTQSNVTSLYTHFNVQYGETYKVRITPVNGAGDGVSTSKSKQIPDGLASPVQNLTLEFKNDSMMLAVAWEEPVQTKGDIFNYSIYIQDGSNPTPKVTSMKTTQFPVRYGVTYNVTVIPVNRAGLGESKTETITIPDGKSEEVQDLTLEFVEGEMKMTVNWSEPKQTNGKILLYRVELDDRLGTQSNVTSLHTHFSVKYGKTYKVRITPVNGAGDGVSTSKSIQISDSLSSPVQNITLDFKNDSMMLAVAWEEPVQTNGNISEYRINIQDGSNTTSRVNSTKTSMETTQFPVRYGITYNVTVIPVNRAGLGKPKTETITIPDGKSSQVELLKVKLDETKMSIDVTWEEPSETNGKITEYKVWLTDMNDQIIRKNATSFTDIDFTAMHGVCYNIKVTPVNGAGDGETTNQTIQIPDGLPGAVRDIHMSHIGNKYAVLHWIAPLVSNGTIVQYYINASGRPAHMVHVQLGCDSTCNRQCGGRNVSFQTNPGNNIFNVNQKSFEVNLTLLAYTNYTVTVQPLTNAGVGQIETVQFKTKEDVPTEPKNVRVENVTASNLVVAWDKPDRYNGNTLFCVHVQHEQNGDIPQRNCKKKVNRLFVNNLMAFWNYTIIIEAKNSAGNISSIPITIRTKSKAPGMVQRVKIISNKPRTVDIYWNQPSLEERNGEIENYAIHYSYRHGKNLINESMLVNETPSRQSLTIIVHPEVELSVTIKAENQAGQGEGITVIKRVPAFRLPKPVEITPMIRKSYNNPVTDNKRQISIELPLLFLCNDSYGSIQESGIVATRDIDNSGIDPLEHADPKFHPRWSESINSKSILSYRVTDTAWNSYCILRDKGATRSKTIDYVVGADRNCENNYHGHCNGYLTPDTIYRFKVFVCTTAGCTYSDYSKQMATEAEESSHMLAICIVIALLIIVVSVILGYLVYRRRSRCGMDKYETKNKETHMEMCVEASRNRPVKLASFDQHVTKLHLDTNLGFSEEYKAIKRLSNKYSTKASERESCRIKNRYTNVLPYDQTRVKLLPVDDEDGSEYINANFLPGYNSKREYIAAQGPLPATLDDFWRMIWEHHVTVVVMLTQCSEKGTTKCERYWPETNEPIYFGDLIVRMRSESVLPDHVIRIIDVQLGIKKRTIKQFHFLKWPDFGCPEKTWLLLNFVTAVRSHISNSQNGPILAHCSAGVGRTGTFIAVDVLLQKIRETDEVDIFNLVLEMRENRPLMVQTENQYIYIHDCIRDALMDDTDEEESMSEHLYENQIIYENT